MIAGGDSIHSSFPFKKNLSSSVMPEGKKNGGASSKGWAESAPHGRNRVN